MAENLMGRCRVGFLSALLALGFIGCERSPAPGPGPASNASATAERPIAVFGAASTIDVMTKAAQRFENQTGVTVQCSFDATSSLARQIIAGAPVDVFLSADEKWMDEVAAAEMIDPTTRRDLLGNDLVLIAPKDRPIEVRMERAFDFAALLADDGRIALADPSHVPAGRYAQAALEWLGWWPPLQDRIIPALDVRAALKLVERGEADAGVVYSTDARASEAVFVAGIFPAESHEPIRYPVALVVNAHSRAAEFLEFLSTAEMRAVFEAAGFVPLP